mgnify:CR=1 FL=1
MPNVKVSKGIILLCQVFDVTILHGITHFFDTWHDVKGVVSCLVHVNSLPLICLKNIEYLPITF